jgi:DNA-directed RNA polymerase specialized sigma24 family protein
MAKSADLNDLLTQMRITNRLLAAGLKATMKQQDLIALLAGIGASAAEIAGVLDTTPGTVAVALHRARAKKTKA